MFKILSLLILVMALSVNTCAFTNERLREQILSAREIDQSARQKVIEALNGSLNNQIPVEIENSIAEIDQAHNAVIKETIDVFGWPGISLVGEDGSNAFWLLVQHQDRDISLQIECLKLLEEAVKNEEASSQDLAFLVDRIRKNQKLPQLYGTQWKTENGKMVLYPVEDFASLDQRRKSANLPPFEEYKKALMEGLKLSEDAFQ